MYKTKDLTPEDLSKIKIKNQAEIVQFIGSELNLIEAHQLIKKESKGFTEPNANAEKADAYLYAIYKGEAITVTTDSQDIVSEWKNISKKEAMKKFEDEEKVYALGENDQKILIESKGLFSLANKFAIQVLIKKEAASESLTKEQIRILKVKKETELALLTLKLKQKQKRKSA
ncbi:hypothetical protein [uncultured Aquimarina sp.]|uniref:hypothetical protein n=1 Tax=uncultured Aquimarina sp. TaxID=575652 RepID=UPI0026275096|nr:hypothetical protein [uncultured Aquimarina sp.]